MIAKFSGTRAGSPFFIPTMPSIAGEAWQNAVRTGMPYKIEYRFRDRTSNSWKWFMGRALPVRDYNGNIVRWYGTCTDIDEQKRVEADLRRANLDLEQFAFSASHDLQEPIRSIKIFSEILTRTYEGAADARTLELLGYLHSGATRMELLVRDLLAYTQVSKLDMPEEPADAVAIEESDSLIESELLPSVKVHSAHLQQLFQNLIANAIKDRSPERRAAVRISAESREGNCTFSVSDNGIDAAYTETVFGLFKRREPTTRAPESASPSAAEL